MEEVTKNMNDLFAAAKNAEVNYPINNIATIVNTAPLAGAAGGASTFFNLSNILIMIGSILTVATVAVVFTGGSSNTAANSEENNPTSAEQVQVLTTLEKTPFTQPELRNGPTLINTYEEIDTQKPILFELPEMEEPILIDEEPELVIDGVVVEDSNNAPNSSASGFESFHSITLNISANVTIVAGNTPNIEVDANADIREMIALTIEDGMLTIGIKKDFKRAFERKSYYNDINIEVTMSTIQYLAVNGSGDITCRDELKTDKLRIDLNGSGDIELNKVVPNELAINLNGSGDISLYGSGDIDDGLINLNGSGDVCTKSLTVDDLEINLNGSGDVTVTCEKTLEVSIIGSGDVCYSGEPSTTISTYGSGEVHNCGHN